MKFAVMTKCENCGKMVYNFKCFDTFTEKWELDIPACDICGHRLREVLNVKH
jgi:hypothetical protein